MPPELTRARRRSRRLWRRIRSVAALLPPMGFQWVRHLLWYGTRLPLRHPRTLTHHLYHKMARDRDPLLRVTSDKFALRGFVEARLGPGHLPDLYALLDSPEELHALALPSGYVVKATHGSGMTSIVRQDATDTRRLIVRQARRWLATQYWRKNGEWGYRGIRPRLIVEELLGREEADVPPDWKWLCFGGRAALVQVDFNRFTDHTRNFYYPDGTPAPVRMYYPQGPASPCPPRGADARDRGAPFERVRVRARGSLRFGRADRGGEMTHYPHGGNKAFEPPDWDASLGALWPPPPARRLPTHDRDASRSRGAYNALIMPTPKLIGRLTREGAAESRPTIGAARKLPNDLLRQASRRLEIMALVGAALWFVTPALAHVFLYLTDPSDKAWAEFRGVDWLAAASVAVSLGVYAFVRARRRDPALVMDLSLGFMVVSAFGIGVLIHWAQPWFAPTDVNPMITWVGPIILMFAAIVPATPWKMLVAGFIAASMDPLGMVAGTCRSATTTTGRSGTCSSCTFRTISCSASRS